MKSLFIFDVSYKDAFSRNNARLNRGGCVKTSLSQRSNCIRRFCVVIATVVLAALELLGCPPLQAATYYVDFMNGSDSNPGTSTAAPWKRIKGMTGVTGTAASAPIVSGDTIVFKGGVTWTASWPWFLVGGSSSMVKYTTDHTWYNGAVWSQPVFDQQSTGTLYYSNPMGTMNGGGYATINDLKFYRCGQKGVLTKAACLYFAHTHDIALTNNTFDSNTWFSVFFNFDQAGSYSNFTVTGNDFANTTAAIWFASSQPNTREYNFIYTNNTIHDFASMLGCSDAQQSCVGGGASAHGDGFLHYYSNPYGDSSQYLDGFTFCNNRSYGDFTRGIGSDWGEDMTAMLYIEGAVKNGLICNNDISWYPYANNTGTPGIFEAVIDIRDHGNVSNGTTYIVNNTIAGDSAFNSGGSAIMIEGPGSGSVVIKNNIFVIGTYCLWSDTSVPTNVTTDYNERWCPLDDNTFTTDGGHSLGNPSNPLFVAKPTDLRLTSASPAIGKGTNLSGLNFSILNTARNGLARGSSWDIGAYQTVADSTPPASPTGLVVR